MSRSTGRDVCDAGHLAIGCVQGDKEALYIAGQQTGSHDLISVVPTLHCLEADN